MNEDTSNPRSDSETLQNLIEFNTTLVTPKIVIIGIGGFGTNTIGSLIQNMGPEENENLSLIAINTDAASIRDNIDPSNERTRSWLLSKRLTPLQAGDKGQGAGMVPEVAAGLIQKLEAKIRELIHDADVVLTLEGLGKGTGTGGTPVVIQIAKDMGKTVINLAAIPSPLEGKDREARAIEWLRKIRKLAITLTVHNSDLRLLIQKNPMLTYKQGHLQIIIETVLPLIFILVEAIQKRGKGVRNDKADFDTFIKDRHKLMVGRVEINNADLASLEPEKVAAQLLDASFQDPQVIEEGEALDFRAIGPLPISHVESVLDLLKSKMSANDVQKKEAIAVVPGISYGEDGQEKSYITVIIAARDTSLEEEEQSQLEEKPQTAAKSSEKAVGPFIPQPEQSEKGKYPLTFLVGGVEQTGKVPVTLRSRFLNHYKTGTSDEELGKIRAEIKEHTGFWPDPPPPSEKKSLWTRLGDIFPRKLNREGGSVL